MSIVFSLTATIVTVLTYRRVKATILRPLRTEVMKTQVEEILGILEFFAQFNYSRKEVYDYQKILDLNIDNLLYQIGVKPERDEKIYENIAGWIVFIDKDKSNFIYVNGQFDEFQNIYQKKEQAIDLDDLTIENLSVILFTKEYIDSYRKISKFSDNPLLPENMILLLRKIKYGGKFNLVLNIKKETLRYVNEYLRIRSSGNLDKNSVQLLNRDMFMNLNKRLFTHDSDLIKLKECMRKYLRIDEKWL